MKSSANISLLATLLFAFLIFSCKTEDESVISDDELKDAVEYTISSGSGGMAAQFDDALLALEKAETGKVSSIMRVCNTTFDSTVTRSDTVLLLSFGYQYTWSYILNCDLTNEPLSFNFNYNGTGSFDAPRMNGSDQSTAQYVITGLESSNAEYIFNGTFSREGNLESKVGRMTSFSSLISVTLSDIHINKSNRKITNGSAALTISGQTSSGQGFTFDGNITFPGNGSATLVINGHTFTFSI